MNRLERLRIELRAAEQAEELLNREFGVWLYGKIRGEKALSRDAVVAGGLAALAHENGRRSVIDDLEALIRRAPEVARMHDEEAELIRQEEGER